MEEGGIVVSESVGEQQPEKKKRKKKMCPHGRERYRCRDCNGAGICKHGRLRSQCRDCGGGSICEHGTLRCKCRICSPENYRRRKVYEIERRYGLTKDQYLMMFEDQQNMCAIKCGTAVYPFTTTAHVDHDHATGAVRGILCAKCNKGLGTYEIPGFPDRAATYLTNPTIFK